MTVEINVHFVRWADYRKERESSGSSGSAPGASIGGLLKGVLKTWEANYPYSASNLPL